MQYAVSHITASLETEFTVRNLAIKKSKGELISFLDVDDTWLPKKLSQQVSLFKDDKIGVVYSNLYILDQKNNRKTNIK